MKCPVCVEADLVMSDRQNVEIDYCPKCRGVWLDRGELDKIIERSVAETPPPAAPARPDPAYQDPAYQDRGYREHDHKGGYHGKGYKRRKSWLEEIFD